MLPLDQVARNILLVLQSDPLQYRNFGVYWWFVKAFLKRFYDRHNLSLLGDYTDDEQAAMVDTSGGLTATLERALAEFGWNAIYNLGRSTVEAPDGETVTVHDEDGL